MQRAAHSQNRRLSAAPLTEGTSSSTPAGEHTMQPARPTSSQSSGSQLVNAPSLIVVVIVAGAAWQFNAEGAVRRLLSEVNDTTLRL
ncbi:hypothetical protein KUCAC02_021137 [Chaenocephalus aceratus]|uniref:Uncharacterized protein n=1 Tax=Chaenocephalus aceratus TaxID=36190 RepID=A0ACB9XGR7_CHAAC|nr:hypothetical protein KUCAC02_021137 [Chaenocephalus aceratus]